MGKPARDQSTSCGIDHLAWSSADPRQPVALIGSSSRSFFPMSLIECPVALPLLRARSLTGEHDSAQLFF